MSFPFFDLSDHYVHFRATELSLMFNCFYMAVWATNMISMAQEAG
jgi:hypothetical protein